MRNRIYMCLVATIINHRVDTLSANVISSTLCEVGSLLALSPLSLQSENSWKILPIKRLIFKKTLLYWSMQLKSLLKRASLEIYTQWVLDLVRVGTRQEKENLWRPKWSEENKLRLRAKGLSNNRQNYLSYIPPVVMLQWFQSRVRSYLPSKSHKQMLVFLHELRHKAQIKRALGSQQRNSQFSAKKKKATRLQRGDSMLQRWTCRPRPIRIFLTHTCIRQKQRSQPKLFLLSLMIGKSHMLLLAYRQKWLLMREMPPLSQHHSKCLFSKRKQRGSMSPRQKITMI